MEALLPNVLGSGGGGGGISAPGGADTQVQFNDAGALGGDADLTWNKTTNVLTAKGDINLDDGVAGFTTTLQTITPTANRTISLPDATGTVALVAGSSGQVVWNNAGANAGASTLTYDGSILTTSGRFINSYTSVASSPAKVFTGTWFTGGTATTTKPHFLIEPSGATSTAWSTSGTGLGVNAASGFTGNLLDLQVNGSSLVSVAGTGSTLITSASYPPLRVIRTGTSTGNFVGCFDMLARTTGDAADGFGPSFDFTITDSGVTGSVLGALAFVRAGADNTGDFIVRAGAAGDYTEKFRIKSTGSAVLKDAANIEVGTTTGTKIGTATTQKLGFFNKTPVVQPTAVADATDAATVITQLNALLARMRDLGLIAT